MNLIFGGTFLFGSITLSLAFLWAPYVNMLQWRGRYKLADEMNISNPLYRRKYFRKRFSGKIFLANLKGFFVCQLLSIIPIACSFIYAIWRLYSRNWNYTVERILMYWLSGLIAAKMILWFYYIIRFERDFRYTQDKLGIWTPFNNIVYNSHKEHYPEFECIYKTTLGELKERISSECTNRGYTYSESYNLGNEDEILYFTRTRQTGITILGVIDIKEYKDEHIILLNESFSQYWMNHMKRKKREEVKFIFLFCIDKFDEILIERFFRFFNVAQKRGRYRLPVFWVNSERPMLKIPTNVNTGYGREQYLQMRKELLSILSISERYNRKEFP